MKFFSDYTRHFLNSPLFKATFTKDDYLYKSATGRIQAQSNFAHFITLSSDFKASVDRLCSIDFRLFLLFAVFISFSVLTQGSL